MISRLCILVAGALAAGMLSPAPIHAQNLIQSMPSDPGQYYTQGVHAFFAGRSSQADDLLSRALAIDPDDPRVYYFRGLARLRMGRGNEARTDMQIGASLEAQQPGRFSIGHALERVQGGDRLLLERYRREGAAGAASARGDRERVRYEQVVQREADVLYRSSSLPLDQLTSASGVPALRFRPRTPPEPAWSLSALRAVPPVAANNTADDPFPDDPVASGTNPRRPAGAATPAGRTALPAPPGPSPALDEDPFSVAPPSTTPSRATQPPGASPATNPAPPAGANLDENPFGEF
jgi:hypothetical protein